MKKLIFILFSMILCANASALSLISNSNQHRAQESCVPKKISLNEYHKMCKTKICHGSYCFYSQATCTAPDGDVYDC